VSTSIRATQSLCSTCQGVVPAELYARPAEDEATRDEVWMRKTCDTHGEEEVRYWRDAQLFSQLDEVVGDYTWCDTFECLKGVECDRCVDKSYNIMLEVTTRCNLDCPVCCSDANNLYSEPPTIEQILSRLPPARTGLMGKLRRPNIVLFGGEASVRKDLPELIEALVERGYVPRLATNGVRMCDERYLERLRKAGLKWVILQFDGFDDDVSELLRGERLQAMKLEAIEKMTAHGFKVQLGTMMVKDVNTNYAGDLIRFVTSHKDVFWLSFYPHAAQARSLLPTKQTFMSEMLAAIDEQTEGRITRDDFLATLKWLGRAHKVLRLPSLKAKHSTLPMLLMTDGEDYFPLVRLLNPLFALRKLPLVLRLLASLPKALLYQRTYTPPFLKFFVVEKFHSDETVDLEEASNCHMAFMTAQHYVPFDIYNIAYKQAGAWDPPRPRNGHERKLPERVGPTLVAASSLRLAQR
jgi:pyruvate-formate lyase-activating enzyme